MKILYDILIGYGLGLLICALLFFWWTRPGIRVTDIAFLILGFIIIVLIFTIYA